MALARALAVQPQVLLLDEPFGALDAKVRKDLRTWLRNLHEEMNVTTIFVTHDQEEAMDVAGQLVVMNQGRVEQSGSADDLYEKPANEFVMSFVGEVNRLGDSYVRPHDIEIVGDKDENTEEAMVQRIVALGFEIRVELVLADGNEVWPSSPATSCSDWNCGRGRSPTCARSMPRASTVRHRPTPLGPRLPGVHGRRRRGGFRSRLKRRRAGCAFAGWRPARFAAVAPSLPIHRRARGFGATPGGMRPLSGRPE